MTRITTVVMAILALTTEALVPPNPAEGCTTTTTKTVTRGPTPPYWPQCSFDGTARIYTSTVVVDHAVDCHGCNHIRVASEPNVHCPAQIIKTTKRESIPYTIHRSVCAATTATATATATGH